MHVAAEHGRVDVIRTLAESWVLRWIHKTPPERCTSNRVEDNGAVAEALNALGLEHPGDVIIEPRSYTPDGTPVYTVPPELRASHGFCPRVQTRELRSPNRGGASLTDGRSSACAPSRPECSTS